MSLQSCRRQRASMKTKKSYLGFRRRRCYCHLHRQSRPVTTKTNRCCRRLRRHCHLLCDCLAPPEDELPDTLTQLQSRFSLDDDELEPGSIAALREAFAESIAFGGDSESLGFIESRVGIAKRWVVLGHDGEREVW